MNATQHHGRHSFEGKNRLCTMESYQVESIGRFGRMFLELSPLYVNPKHYAALGAVGGPMDAGNSATLTTSVPLGMIFLGQFIDHDITFDTTSNFSNINQPEQTDNQRSPRLDLDCVFGEGPEGSPYLYKSHNEGFYLLTGLTNNNLGQGQATERHDLARNGRGTALIGDPRNDENRIVSQLQLAMIRFYNAIYHDLENDPANAGKDAGDLYKEARELATWHYQWVVIYEFLPAMCGQYMISELLSTGRQFYHPHHHAFIPVEFSVAAYRFGHSMIAQRLKLQPGGTTHHLFSPQIGRGFTRVSSQDQVVEWEAFFDFDGSYQRAEQLDTKMASDLLDLQFIPSTNPADRSLAVRNLRRGQSFLLPAGEEVAEYMMVDPTIIADVKNRISTNLSGTGIDFSLGTPLWYYILAEAEEIGTMNADGTTNPGQGLGPVGGRIVAEVMLGLMEMDGAAFLGKNRDWLPVYGTGGEFTMKDLLTKAATATEL